MLFSEEVFCSSFIAAWHLPQMKTEFWLILSNDSFPSVHLMHAEDNLQNFFFPCRVKSLTLFPSGLICSAVMLALQASNECTSTSFFLLKTP